MAEQLAAHLEIDYSQIQIEDGQPVDNVFSEKQMRLLAESLYCSWKYPRFSALANVGLFYAVKTPPIVPDVMVSVDVDLKPQTGLKKDLSYFVWELGKPPDIAIEIVSNREGGEDTDKVQKYLHAGVGYYVIYDPELLLGKRALRVLQRAGSGFVDMLDSSSLTPLPLGLTLWDGVYEQCSGTWLRWVDDKKQLLRTGAELAAQAQASERRALERAEALEARLRELGVDP